MANRIGARDLFGTPTRARRPRYEAALERAEKASLPARAARVRWLSRVIPKNTGFVMPFETHLVFEEAKSSFVYGHFVATIVLAASFIDHWLAAGLARRGFEMSRGLAASIKIAREKRLISPILLDKADRLRLIRNPFAHLKPLGHQHSISQRIAGALANPTVVLEDDAKEALIAMYGIAVYALRS